MRHESVMIVVILRLFQGLLVRALIARLCAVLCLCSSYAMLPGGLLRTRVSVVAAAADSRGASALGWTCALHGKHVQLHWMSPTQKAFGTKPL
eukprot:1401846-Amphidinium_carterae.1